MLGLIEYALIDLLTFGGLLATKCVSLSNQSCITRPALIGLIPGEFRQILHHYPFMISLDL